MYASPVGTITELILRCSWILIYSLGQGDVTYDRMSLTHLKYSMRDNAISPPQILNGTECHYSMGQNVITHWDRMSLTHLKCSMGQSVFNAPQILNGTECH